MPSACTSTRACTLGSGVEKEPYPVERPIRHKVCLVTNEITILISGSAFDMEQLCSNDLQRQPSWASVTTSSAQVVRCSARPDTRSAEALGARDPVLQQSTATVEPESGLEGLHQACNQRMRLHRTLLRTVHTQTVSHLIPRYGGKQRPFRFISVKQHNLT